MFVITLWSSPSFKYIKQPSTKDGFMCFFVQWVNKKLITLSEIQVSLQGLIKKESFKIRK
jgi:hypothetical protein